MIIFPCDELIARPEESYRLWCVVVCDLENLKNEEAMTHVGSQRHSKTKVIIFTTLLLVDGREKDVNELLNFRLI